jgi:hypothetical protein
MAGKMMSGGDSGVPCAIGVILAMFRRGDRLFLLALALPSVIALLVLLNATLATFQNAKLQQSLGRRPGGCSRDHWTFGIESRVVNCWRISVSCVFRH